jgi:DNA repair protein RecO (recombination protein O)
MEEIINAITLKAVDYGESDKILTLFSLEKGVISAILKGVKKDKAKLKYVAEPFCFCELVISEKAGRHSVINASCHKSYFNISQNLNSYFSTCVMSEFVTVFFKDAEESLFTNFVLALENMLKGIGLPTLLKFCLIGLSYAGYGLDFSGCNKCGEKIEDRVFLGNDAIFLCENCNGENCIEFKISTYNKLMQINNASFKNLDSQDEEVVKNCLRLLDKYIYNRLGIKLKALQFIF